MSQGRLYRNLMLPLGTLGGCAEGLGVRRVYVLAQGRVHGHFTAELNRTSALTLWAQKEELRSWLEATDPEKADRESDSTRHASP